MSVPPSATVASGFANPLAVMIHASTEVAGGGRLGWATATVCGAWRRLWLASSAPEDFPFAMFDEPKPLRRSTTVPGALAELVFGRYQSLDGAWVEHPRTIWLGMIVSYAPGDGGRLLKALQQACVRCDLAMVGTPAPLKPRDWDVARPFSHDEKRLTYWYMRQGFRVVQDGSTTRVVFVGRSSALQAGFSFAR